MFGLIMGSSVFRGGSMPIFGAISLTRCCRKRRAITFSVRSGSGKGNRAKGMRVIGKLRAAKGRRPGNARRGKVLGSGTSAAGEDQAVQLEVCHLALGHLVGRAE